MDLIVVAKAAATWGPRLLLFIVMRTGVAAASEPQAWRLIGPGALIESTDVHLGARPAGDLGEAAITIQLTVKTPW